MPTRRRVLQTALTALAASRLHALGLKGQSSSLPPRRIAPGKFQPNWESLRSQYKTPEWFRDAKFGIWAHWSAQCVPEQGDWYARQMYIQGHPQYEFHCKTYGHPSKVGFKEIDHMWRAENWQPDQLMDLYKKAGAKYFMSLANHHDNLDNFNSRYHDWNSTKIGPMKDIIGTWSKTAREHGLKFGVSNHSGHSWHWFQTAYGYDLEGPLAGVPYDGFTLASDGKGKWWDGHDPQQLYNGPIYPMPKGITSIKEANDWHAKHDREWSEAIPPDHPGHPSSQEFVDRWFLRCQDLLDTYQPDLIYFDNTELPLQQAGLDMSAHYYNSSADRGAPGIIFAKQLKPEHEGAVTLDIERGRAKGILTDPWQTDTCIGDWHYSRKRFTDHSYKSSQTVISMLVDIVSKNGNLLLSIPVRGDGTIDEDEHKFLGEMSEWIAVNGEGIFGTRPFTVFGEGPPDVMDNAMFNENKSRKLDANDIRYTVKGSTIYAFVMGWPDGGKLVLKTLKQGAPEYPHTVKRVELLGSTGVLQHTRTAEGLIITLPPQKIQSAAYGFKIQS